MTQQLASGPTLFSPVLPPRPQAAHPAADIAACMVELAALFPSIDAASESEKRLWEAEFGGRPAELCIAALQRAKLATETPFLPIAVWERTVLAIASERCPGTTPAERSAAYLRHMKEAFREAERATDAAMAFCARLPDGELERLHRQALERLMLNAGAFNRWLRKDPRTTAGQASLVLAEWQRERMEGEDLGNAGEELQLEGSHG